MPKKNEPTHDPFLSALRNRIEQEQMLSPPERWLVAVSGGRDSMALLHGLVMMGKEGLLQPPPLHIAHLNHRLRGAESDRDADFVREQAQKLGLGITVVQVNVLQKARDTRQSLETAAREARYHFLGQTAIEQKCQKIVLAHNANDDVETILQRILRGTGIRGLSGIPAVRPMIIPGNPSPEVQLIRPLLKIKRSDIETFIRRHSIPYQDDRSNRDRRHTRNRIRHELLPLLREQYNPRVDNALLKLKQIAGALQAEINTQAQQALGSILMKLDSETAVLDAEKLARYPKTIQAEILHLTFQKLHIPLQPMDHHHFQTILNGLAQRRISGSCQLPRGARVEFSEKTMMIGKKPDTPQPTAPRDNHPIALALPGIIQLQKENVYRIDPDQKTGQKIQSIRTDIFPGGIEELTPFQSSKTVREEVIDRDRLEGGLELRTRNPGDSFHPLGAPGGKKLGDFFSDHKIPKNIRDSIGLIYDQAGIVWVPGLRIAERVKVTSATRTLLKFTLNESG